MKQILLSGCSGKMGRAVSNAVAGRDDCRIVAGIDIGKATGVTYPVFASPEEYKGSCDVVIDFSHPSALSALLTYITENKKPAVICTTGLSDEQVNFLREAAVYVPIFYSGNMSLGINLLIELSKKATAILGGSFDIEIIEKHHNQKIDAPSGTALMLADAIGDTLETSPKYEYDRHSKRMKRTKNEIGIHAVRGGNIVGEHEVIFAGHDEIITLSHSARSKEVFAVGAVNAALYLCGKKPSLYDMGDLIQSS